MFIFDERFDLDTTSGKLIMSHSFRCPALCILHRGVSWWWKLLSLKRGIFWAPLPVKWPVVTLSDQWCDPLIDHSSKSCVYKFEVDRYSRSWVTNVCLKSDQLIIEWPLGVHLYFIGIKLILLRRLAPILGCYDDWELRFFHLLQEKTLNLTKFINCKCL